MCLASETSRYTKGGESLGDEESSKEKEEVVPALIRTSGVRPLAPDVKLRLCYLCASHVKFTSPDMARPHVNHLQEDAR